MSVTKAITTGAIGAIGLSIGVFALLLQPFSPAGASFELTSTVQPEAVQRNLYCTGGVVGHLRDSAEVLKVAETKISISGGEVSDPLSAAKGKNGFVITHTGDPTLLAAAETAGFGSADVSGLLAAECGDGTSEQWLVGGSTTTGRDSIITITNGSDVESHVDIEVWGANGKADAPGSKGLVVPPLSQRSYSAAGFIPSEESPIFHIISTGGSVWSTLETSVVRGLQAGGLDRTGPSSTPNETQLFPIFRIQDEKEMGPINGNEDYKDVQPAIRLLTESADGAEVSIALQPAGGGESHTVTANLTAGRVTDLLLADLEPGDYSISLRASAPIIAGLRAGWHEKKSENTDMAWIAPVPAATGSISMQLPLSGTVAITNPGTKTITVNISTSKGDRAETVEQGQTVYLEADAGLMVLQSDAEYAAATFLQNDYGIATIRALAPPVGIGNIRVTAK